MAVGVHEGRGVLRVLLDDASEQRSSSTIPPSDSRAFIRRATSLRASSSSLPTGVSGTLGAETGGRLRGLRRRPAGLPLDAADVYVEPNQILLERVMSR